MWYRVADMKTRMRSHTLFHRHTYRGKEWYVLQDQSTGRFHRFSPEAYIIIGLMDGSRTMEEIWKAACSHLGDDMPTQDEVINLLSYLHQSDLLQSDIPPDISDLHRRRKRERVMRLLNRVRSPAAMTIPLFDPDRFLDRTIRFVRPVFGWGGLLLWCAVTLSALVLAGIHWSELTTNVTDRVLSTENLLLLGLIYPVTRLIHEFGHAYAVKRWGGEVHEVGIMFLVFMPIPYVDASASTAFKHKGQRIMVSAAGIMVEVFLAAAAVHVWVHAGPGAVRALAYNVMFISGISTLLFNGNPLLRYDAYYILADFLEIPSLGDRGIKYVGYLLQHYSLGISDADSPAQAPGEEPWLVLYTFASFLYRILISISIVFFIAGRFFVIGIVLAIWTGLSLVISPCVKAVRSIFVRYPGKAARIGIIGSAVAVLLAALVFVAPFPSFTATEGVVWMPESQVYAGTDGFVLKILAEPGTIVSKGDPLIFCEAPELRAEMRVLEADLRENEARYRLSLVSSRTETQKIRDEISRVQDKLALSRERLGELVVRSPADGMFILPKSQDLPGSFAHKGAPLGYVVDFSKVVVRVIVNQADVEHIRHDTRKIQGRLAGSFSNMFTTTIEREVPAASKELPSLALSLQGGGTVALDPKEGKTPQAFEKLFLFDLSLKGVRVRGIGERAFIRFEHSSESLASKWYRDIRRMLLKRFGV